MAAAHSTPRGSMDARSDSAAGPLSAPAAPGVAAAAGVPAAAAAPVSLLEFLEAGPEQVDLMDFLALSTPATEVVLGATRKHAHAGAGKAGGGGNGSNSARAPPIGLNGQAISAKQLPELATYLRSLAELNGRTHTWSLKRFADSFTGEELVNVLVRKGVCANKDEAEKIGQRLVDEHHIWHAAVDMPFKGNGAPFRFITPAMFSLAQTLTDPQKGIAQAKQKGGAARKESISNSTVSLFEELRKVTFRGSELCDWLLVNGQLKPKTKDQAVRTAQALLDAHVIHCLSNTAESDLFGVDHVYGISREKVSLQSLTASLRREMLNCAIGDQIGKTKWKQRLCILMHTQQRLYLFNGEDAVIPRSIINLRSAIVRQAEASLVGKPFCVQITTEGGSVVLETASEEACAAWAADLSSLTIDRAESNSEVGRQSRSLRFRIVEAKDLAQGTGSFYCTITMAEAVVARTQVQRNVKNPAWNEEFFFMEVPSTVDDVKVTLWSRGQLQEQELSAVVVKLSALSSHVEVEEWFPLLAPAGKKGESDKKAPASLSLRFALEYELILPLKSYEPLLTLVTTDFKLLASLLSLTKAEREQVTQTVLRILMTQNKATEFVMELARREIAATAERTVLFRVNTVGTKAIVEYLKLASVGYVRDTLRPFVMGIDKYAIDPDKSATLLAPIRDLFDAIYDSVLRIPSELFMFFYQLSSSAIDRFKSAGVTSDDDAVTNVGLMVVNGFFFLRLMCAAVVAPKIYGVIDTHPDERVTRILKTLGRVLQYLANFKIEVDADLFDAEGAALLNGFLKDNNPRMKSFIRQIANEDNGATQRLHLPAAELNIDLERDLASLYATIIRYNQELTDLVRDGARTSLTNMMEDVSGAYKARWPGRSTPYQYKISLADAMLFLK